MSPPSRCPTAHLPGCPLPSEIKNIQVESNPIRNAVRESLKISAAKPSTNKTANGTRSFHFTVAAVWLRDPNEDKLKAPARLAITKPKTAGITLISAKGLPAGILINPWSAR